MRYLLDTAIWIDILENRTGYNNEPLGDYALKLLLKAEKIVITDFVVKELLRYYSMEQVNGIFKPWEFKIDKIFVEEGQKHLAKVIAAERKIPFGDVVHAISAREHKLILVARDKHFKLLRDISGYFKPEELI